MRLIRTLVFLSLPVGWVVVACAVWHFHWFSLLLPVSLVSLAIPASFAYAGIIGLPAGTARRTLSHPALSLMAVASLVIAYACSLYAFGRVAQLLPEVYKFGSSLVDVSRSTVRLWGILSLGSISAALVLYRLLPSGSLSHLCVRGAIATTAATSLVFVPFLLSSHANYRA